MLSQTYKRHLSLASLKLFFWVTLPIASNAIPRRGNDPWSMILCKFKDLSWHEPKPREWFEEWLFGAHQTESVERYFTKVSNGVYSITGSNVHGWITINLTQKDVLARISKLDVDEGLPMLGTDASFDYLETIKELCLEAAVLDGFKPHRQRITVINTGTMAVFGKKTGVLISSELMFSSVLTHEMVFPYAASGEYDDRYDLMSTANAFMYRTKFGITGPGLNGAHLDFLGWLPMNRMLYFGRDDPQSYYTVELRTPRSFDKGIKQPSVLIHRVERAGKNYYSYLQVQSNEFYELTENTEWVKFLGATSLGQFQTIRISVGKVRQDEAEIFIASTFDPNQCLVGEIAIRPNSNLSGRTTDRKPKYVCVNTTDSSLVSALQEAQIEKQIRRNTFYVEMTTFGANSCQKGLVWRGLDQYDYTCVTSQRYEIARLEARKHDIRADPESPDQCMGLFIKRHAFPGDKNCVLISEKIMIHRENLHSPQKLQNLAFFNGADTVEL